MSDKSESDSLELQDDSVITDDSRDGFQLSKSTHKIQKRSYRKQHQSVGDSAEIRKSDKETRRERPGHNEGRRDRLREEKKRKRADEAYRDRREKSREAFERERRVRDFGRDRGPQFKRRDERIIHESRGSHSPIQPSQRYDHHDRGTSYRSVRPRSKVDQAETSKRSREDRVQQKERQVSRLHESGSESEGEIHSPLAKKRHSLNEPLSGNVRSLIHDLESSSSSGSSDEEDVRHSSKDRSRSRSPDENSDSQFSSRSPKRPAKTWRDIAEESSESETEEKDTVVPSVEDDMKFSQLSEKFFKYSEMQSVSSSDIEETEDLVKEDSQATQKQVEATEEPMDQEKEQEAEEGEDEEKEEEEKSILPPYLPALMGCRSVECYEWLNRIEEGTYGVVFRGKDKRTGEVVALKKLKMEKEREGFPITSLREINMLLKSSHPNIVHVREIVVGSNMDKIYIVMDYVEHDLKSLMEVMKQPFLEGEVKTLMIQLLRAVHHLHDNWILHRDLKTSNLLLSHKGILKVADFGLAREYGSPLKRYTPVVVTLWYRCPELLLGAKEYSTAVDVWSVGCIFAELLQHKPIFMGKSEIDQLNQIFKELGTPNNDIWPGYSELPVAKKVDFAKQPLNNLRKRFPMITNSGFNLLNKFLTYDPKRRVTAEEALRHPYFEESPLPVDPGMFPTWPAKSEMIKKQNRQRSPTAPEGGAFLLNQAKDKEDEAEGKFHLTQAQSGKAAVGPGFTLKF